MGWQGSLAVHLLTSFQCHKLASALPGVSLHCVVLLFILILFPHPQTHTDTYMCDDQSDQSK